MSTRLVLVGCGNMGHAMLSGWMRSGTLTYGEVTVVEPETGLRERATALGAEVLATADELPAAPPRLVVLAVKPQLMLDVARQYRRLADGGAAFLSVAAGISTAALAGVLGQDAPIIRCMPNTPAAIGKGMMVFYDNGRVDKETIAFVEELLSASGAVARVEDEEKMHAVTAVSGSGPAYVFHFIECLAEAGRKAGLESEVARLLAVRTVEGAAILAAQGTDDAATLRKQVTSPNGTTQAALEVLMGGGRLGALIEEAVEAARKRSVELGG